MKYGSMMSTPTWTKRSGSRMCSMFASDPVSKLSAQITRLPRASSSSHRCDPRNPAPPVTRHVAIAAEAYAIGGTILLSVMSATAEHAAQERAAEAAVEEHLTVAPIVGPDDPRRFTDPGIEISELYGEDDLPAQLDLGEPGEFPYTRGVHREMYRKQTWTMRQYAGYASAKESNERYRYLLSKG